MDKLPSPLVTVRSVSGQCHVSLTGAGAARSGWCFPDLGVHAGPLGPHDLSKTDPDSVSGGHPETELTAWGLGGAVSRTAGRSCGGQSLAGL